ncbi:MAG: tRNA pseudouridine(38-40) synthase TruA [Ruminococcus sp.]|nr:tRNA pseudouridine(38-40) synthase TruA [Ruminococcus sp.]
MQHILCGENLRNLLITISYDGRQFHGWQIQKNGITVQEVFQEALTKIVGEYKDLKGCSRTDSGVHALMYCISVRIAHPIEPVRLKAALNRWLPSSVSCLDCVQVSDDFHARYDCKSKQYKYKIWNSDTRNPFLNGYALFYPYKLDAELLNKTAQDFVGKHDFTSFCTLDKREVGDMSREVKHFEVERDGDLVVMTVEADGFLYNMVRIMVGTLLEIAQGKIKPDAIPEILNKHNRLFAGATAQACGLYLDKVNY